MPTRTEAASTTGDGAASDRSASDVAERDASVAALLSHRGDPLAGSLCFALYSAAQATVQYYRDVLAPYGLTYQQLLVLAELLTQGPVAPGWLAETLHLDSSSVSGLLNRMERQDLVAREAHPHDRRGVLVTATDHGRAVVERLGFLPECVTRAMGVTPESAETLVTALHTLHDTLVAAARPEPPARSE